MDQVLVVSETRFAFHIESLEKPTLLTLKLQNKSNDQVGFKVKTTRPRRYCVKPNAAVLAPGETMDLQVQLQPLKRLVSDACAALARQAESRAKGDAAVPSVDDLLTYEGLKQELSKELRDKFLIQALLLKNRPFDPALFDNVERDEVYEQKFRCEFLFSQDMLENTLRGYRSRFSVNREGAGAGADGGAIAADAGASAAQTAGDDAAAGRAATATTASLSSAGAATTPSVHWDDAATEQSKAAAADRIAETDLREESEVSRLRRELARSQAEVALLTSRMETSARLGRASNSVGATTSTNPTMLLLPWVQLIMAIMLGILVGKYVLAA
ncbi:hypothetical protein CCYA_CCYA11G3205 [Cyanidiococcus yangmingshanensis]|nr:hypothetical protein CCYA_CCYA11G3205 [Cyanidiococcus yangmingshanensis]